MMRIPCIDMGRCSECEGCLSVCPAVFHFNAATDMIEVIDMAIYPEECVDEAIKNCPADCITWEER